MTAAEIIKKQNEEARLRAQAMAQAQMSGASAAELAAIAQGVPTTTGAARTASTTKNTAGAQVSAASKPTIYQQALDSVSPTFSTVNYDNVLKRDVDEGFRTATDADKALWADVIAAQNAGDTEKVTDLLNSMRAQGNFSGYYGDDGLYYGFARGYGGAAGNSYQPVIGGKLISSGNVDTNQWLTPDGKAYTGNLGGDLSSAGVWSYGDNKKMASVPMTTKVPSGNGVDSAPAAYSPETTITPKKTLPVDSAPQGIGSFSDGITSSGTPTGSNPYIEALEATTLTPAPKMDAPAAYDPNSDPLWQQYLSEYQNAKAPEWNETFRYEETPEYQRYLDEYQNAKAPEYEGSPYDAMRDEAINAAKGPFSYDLEKDPAWQAYRKQYTREGRRASEDTLGQMAALTGGVASSAAATAAAQARNYYGAQMTDKIPQLYQDAYNRYLNEYQKQMGIASAYNQYGQQDYNQFRDRLSQWNTDRNFNYGAAQDAIGNRRSDYGTRYQQYLDQLGQFNTDRSFAYGAARDNQQLGRQAVEDQYNRYRDAIGDQRYDQEWAQQLREYADSQSWKAKDWEQYLREYADKLSEADRDFAYQQYRDAIDDERYADETGYKRNWNEDEREYEREQAALDRDRQAMLDLYDREEAEYARALNEAKLGAAYGDWSGLQDLGIDPNSGNVLRQALAEAGRTTPVGSGSGGSSGSGGQSGYSTSTVNAAYKAYLSGDRSDLTLRILDSAGLLGEMLEDNDPKKVVPFPDLPENVGIANRNDENGIYVRGKYYLWDDLWSLVQNNTLRYTYNQKSNRVTFDIPKEG